MRVAPRGLGIWLGARRGAGRAGRRGAGRAGRRGAGRGARRGAGRGRGAFVQELERAAEGDGVKPIALVHAVGGGREVKQRQPHPLAQLPRARDT